MSLKQFTDVEVFVRVVEMGSYAAASKHMGISRSHASRLITQLETRLGVRLLHRSTRRISTTHTGLTFYEAASPLLESMKHAEARASAERDEVVGTLRVSLPVSFGRRYLSAQLAAFQKRFPELSVLVDLTDRKVDLVAEGYDLAVRGGAVENNSLVAKRLWPFRVVAVGAPEYLDNANAINRPADLSRHRCLLYSGMANPRAWRFKRGKEETVVNVNGPVTSNSTDAILDCALAGLGVAYLPDFEVHEHLASGRLRAVLKSHEPLALHFWAVRPHRSHLPARVRACLEFLGDLWPTTPWSAA
ncbi:MAG: LysR family transcriptional regulator [Deltaproteobacteria bacterium]|nr:LysR family transcriptional regulator [Deltaproteobacteria bacterium]